MTTTDTSTPAAPHIGTRMVRREDAPLLNSNAPEFIQQVAPTHS